MKKHKLKSFSKLSTGERIAILSFVGTILAAFIGGIFGLLSVILPTTFKNNQTAENVPLKIAHIAFDDWISSSIYGLPQNSDTSEINDQDKWDKKRDILNIKGYRVLYYSSDFSSINSLLPPNSNIPSATLDKTQPFPIIPLSIELWNINKETTIVIDDVIIELQQYTPVSTDVFDLFFQTGPGIGGGSDLPKETFNVSLFPNSNYINLLRENNSRIILEPQKAIIVILVISFSSPGRYKFSTSINYHFPDGATGQEQLNELIYSWMAIDFVDGSEIQIIR
jgi:hypothetical protein